MAVNVTISVNAQPALNEAYKLNSAINEIKVNAQNIPLDVRGASKGMNSIKVTAEGANTVLGTTSKQLNEVKKGVAGVTAESKQAASFIGKMAGGLFSWWTALILAVEMATKTFTYFFQNLTQNVDKLTTRSQTAIKSAQRIQQREQKQAKTARDLVKQLEELNKIQKLNDDQRRLGESVLNKLNREYQELGITLDKTTGKYQNLYEAQIKLDERQKRARVQSIRNQIDAQRDVINAALVKAFGRGIQLDQFVKGNDFFNIAERLGGTIGAQNADMLARMWNTKDIQKQIEVIERLVGGLSMSEQVVQNSPAALDAMYVLKDYQDQLKDIGSTTTRIAEQNKRLSDSFSKQREEIDKTREAIQKLQKARKEDARNEVVNNLTTEQRINVLKQQTEALKQRNAKLDEERAKKDKEQTQTGLKANFLSTDLQYNQKIEEDRISRQIQKKKEQLKRQKQLTSKAQSQYQKAESKKKTVDMWSLTGDKETNAQYEQALKALNAEQAKEKALSKDIADLQNKLTKAKEKSKQLEIDYNKAQTQNLNVLGEIAELDKQREQTLTQIQNKEQQIAALERQINEQKIKTAQKEQEAIDATIQSYKAQIAAFDKTDLQNKIDDALASAQRAKGSDLSPAQINMITKYVEELDKATKLEEERRKKKQQSDNIQNLFQGYAQNQSLAYLKLIGAQKQAVLLEAKLNAEKAKGAALTEAEYESLKNFIDVQQMIEQALSESNNKPQLMTTGVITNQLAAKGGFASSVVTDRAQDINAQILKTQNKQYDVQKSIKDAIEKYSVIQ